MKQMKQTCKSKLEFQGFFMKFDCELEKGHLDKHQESGISKEKEYVITWSDR